MTEYLIVFGVVVAGLAAIYRLLGLSNRFRPEPAPTGSLTFTGPRGRVKIDAGPMVAMTIAKHSAGVMIGRHIIDTEDVVVDEVTVEALGNRVSRSSEPHESAHTAWYLRTDGRIGYIGEWQTAKTGDYLGGYAAEWQRRLREDKTGFPHTLFALVYPDGVRLWEGEVATGRIVELAAA